MGNEPAATAAAAGYQVGEPIIDLGQHRVSRNGGDILLLHLSYEPPLAQADRFA